MYYKPRTTFDSISILQDDHHSTFSQLTSNLASAQTEDSSSTTPPEAWGGERFSDKFLHEHQSINMPSRFAKFASSSSSGLMSSGLQESLPSNQSTSSLTLSLNLTNTSSKDASNQDISLGSPTVVSSPLGAKSIAGLSNINTFGTSLSIPKRFSSYAERIGATPSLSETSPLSLGSQKSKKTGAETREELLNSLLSRSDNQSALGSSVLATNNVRSNSMRQFFVSAFNTAIIGS